MTFFQGSVTFKRTEILYKFRACFCTKIWLSLIKTLKFETITKHSRTKLGFILILFALQADITTSDSNSRPLTDLSVGTLKKHKLNVTFQGKKVTVKNSPIEAQCVSITLSVDKLKDKKNSLDVNSKEFVPRNSIPNDTAVLSSGTSEADSKSVGTTRSSSPGSSQDDMTTKEVVANVSDDRIKNQSTNALATATTPSSVVVPGVASARGPVAVASSPSPVNHHSSKDRTVDSIKHNVINHTVSSKNDTSHVVPANVFRPTSAHPPASSYDKDRNTMSNTATYNRYGSPKVTDTSAAPASKVGKTVSTIVDKLKNVTTLSSPNNETRTKVIGGGGPPSSSPHSSQTQSPASMPPNAQMPPYLFLPPGPVHFPHQFMHIPASVAAAGNPGHPPQQLGSSMPLFLPPYPPTYLSPAAAAPPPPGSAHSQAATYHMPPASSPYQPYMQPMAVAPFFSQPPFSQQFYQTSHMQHSWSHLPPSYHVSGAGGGGGNINLPHQGGGGGNTINKSDVPAGPLMSSKFKWKKSSLSNFANCADGRCVRELSVDCRKNATLLWVIACFFFFFFFSCVLPVSFT